MSDNDSGSAKDGDTVKMHYTGTLEDGTQFDSSTGRDPLEFKIGEQTIIPTLEQAVVDMSVGDTKTVKIAAEDAYGPRHDEAVQTVERSMIPEGVELTIGGQLQATAPNGQQLLLTVTAIEGDQITLDANHPLAGQDLTFDIELVSIG